MAPVQGTPAIGADLASVSDDELLAAAQDGDERAFESLYQRYRSDIRAFCTRLVPDPHIAEDLTQETFLRAFHHIGRFERGRPMWPWLATIAKRLCVDEMRGTSRRAALGLSVSPLEDGAYDATSEEALARVERQRLNGVLTKALAALRPRDRSVFVLQNIEGWSHEEIARQQGLSVHAVRNLAWRARRALRRSLGNERLRNWSGILALHNSKPRRRWRPRPWVDGHMQGAVLERAAALLLGLTAAGVTILGGDAGTRVERRDIGYGPARPAAARDLGSAASVTPPRRDATAQNGRSGSPPSIVVASVSLAPKEPGAAAASGGKLGLEIRSPDGTLVLWYEHEASCGGQGGSVLPREGPVTIVC